MSTTRSGAGDLWDGYSICRVAHFVVPFTSYPLKRFSQSHEEVENHTLTHIESRGFIATPNHIGGSRYSLWLPVSKVTVELVDETLQRFIHRFTQVGMDSLDGFIW